MLESAYQSRLIIRLRQELPGCVVLKNDSGYQQGIPDLLILFGQRWAALEVKKSANAKVQPNQDYFVDLLNELSYAAYIYPENEEEIFRALQQTFKPLRKARIS